MNDNENIRLINENNYNNNDFNAEYYAPNQQHQYYEREQNGKIKYLYNTDKIHYTQMNVSDWKSIPSDPSPYSHLWENQEQFTPQQFSHNANSSHKWNDLFFAVLFYVNIAIFLLIALYLFIGDTEENQFSLLKENYQSLSINESSSLNTQIPNNNNSIINIELPNNNNSTTNNQLSNKNNLTIIPRLTNQNSVEQTNEIDDILKDTFDALIVSLSVGILINIAHFSYALFHPYSYVKFGTLIGIGVSIIFSLITAISTTWYLMIFPLLMIVVYIIGYCTMKDKFECVLKIE